MFGNPSKRAITNAAKALDFLDLNYQETEGNLVLSAMGDDLPIGMAIMSDEGNMTLNIYCYLMFDVPSESSRALVPELNVLNNTINNGGFYMSPDGDKIYFKIVQSYFDQVPSVKTIAHLIAVAFKTVDINDGKLKGLVPKEAIRRDLMYS